MQYLGACLCYKYSIFVWNAKLIGHPAFYPPAPGWSDSEMLQVLLHTPCRGGVQYSYNQFLTTFLKTLHPSLRRHLGRSLWTCLWKTYYLSVSPEISLTYPVTLTRCPFFTFFRPPNLSPGHRHSAPFRHVGLSLTLLFHQRLYFDNLETEISQGLLRLK